MKTLVKVASKARSNEITFRPGTLEFFVSGPNTVRTLLMQQASNWWILAISNNVPLWNGSALNSQVRVTVTFAASHGQNWVNNLITGTAYNAERTSATSLTLGADPMIIAISPN